MQPADARVPWLLRAATRDADLGPADREKDRTSALTARRLALGTLPLVMVVWLAAALFAAEWAMRATTVVALVVSVMLSARAAVTTQRYRRRWMSASQPSAPPAWVTLATIAVAMVAIVAAFNVVADVRAGRSAAVAMMLAALALAAFQAGVLAHVSGGRSVGAALRAPGRDADPADSRREDQPR